MIRSNKTERDNEVTWEDGPAENQPWKSSFFFSRCRFLQFIERPVYRKTVFEE